MCDNTYDVEMNIDTMAIHLMDVHHWSYQRACHWLMERVEEEAI